MHENILGAIAAGDETKAVDALEHGLTAYDAACPALAMSQRVAIATNDSAFVTAARKQRMDGFIRLPPRTRAQGPTLVT